MKRLGPSLLLLLLVSASLPAQQPSSIPPSIVPVSDPQAVALLQRSLTAMTNGIPVTDATLSGTAQRIAGSDDESGEVVLQAKGSQESRIALTLSNSTYTEVRNVSDGAPAGSYVGSDGVVYQAALHNCFAGTAWFLPLLSAVPSAISSSGANISYIGPETLDGSAVQHVRSWLSVSSPDAAAVQSIAHLSTTDIYLDSATNLPVAISFTSHPDDNSSVDIAVVIQFSNYQRENGILVPLHIQKFLNGSLALDLTISSVTINSGLSDSDFTME